MDALIKAIDHTDAATLGDLQEAYGEAVEILASGDDRALLRDYALRLLALIDLDGIDEMARAA